MELILYLMIFFLGLVIGRFLQWGSKQPSVFNEFEKELSKCKYCGAIQ